MTLMTLISRFPTFNIKDTNLILLEKVLPCSVLHMIVHPTKHIPLKKPESEQAAVSLIKSYYIFIHMKEMLHSFPNPPPHIVI